MNLIVILRCTYFSDSFMNLNYILYFLFTINYLVFKLDNMLIRHTVEYFAVLMLVFVWDSSYSLNGCGWIKS